MNIVENKIYTVIWTDKAKKMLKDFDEKTINFIINKVEKYLVLDPWGKGKRLDGELKDFWSFRCWPYRVVYKIYENQITIEIFGVIDRKDNYRRITRLLKT